jgi:hypothetical protein
MVREDLGDSAAGIGRKLEPRHTVPVEPGEEQKRNGREWMEHEHILCAAR